MSPCDQYRPRPLVRGRSVRGRASLTVNGRPLRSLPGDDLLGLALVWYLSLRLYPCPGRGLSYPDYPAALFPIFRELNILGGSFYTHLRAHETDSYLVCRLL